MTVENAIGIGTVAFGALQTLALVITLWVMRQTAIRQLRAYVAFESAQFIKDPGNDSGPWSIDIVFKNFGQTPARDLVVKVEAEIGTPKASDTIFPVTNKAMLQSKSGLPPQHPYTVRIDCPEVAPGVDGILAARWAGNKAYVWGRADYIDVFKKRRFISFQLIGHFEEIVNFVLCSSNGNDSD